MSWCCGELAVETFNGFSSINPKENHSIKMGEILDMFTRMSKRAANDIIFNSETDIKESVACFKLFTEEIRKELLKAESNHNKPIFPNTPYKKGRSSKRLVSTSSSDEEIDVSSTKIQLHNSSQENTDNPETASKPKRGAAKAASANIKKVSNMKLNSKMRRPSTDENNTITTTSNVFECNLNLVKTEKRSEILEVSAKNTALSDVTNEMPPPTAKPKRGRKKVKKETEDSDTSRERVTRSTRSKVKEQPSSTRTTATELSPRRKDSDVQIQEVPVTVVVVTDSESETDKSQKSESEVKTKRGRKPKKNKMTMNLKIKEEPIQEEPKAATPETKNTTQEDSVYEDALSENKEEPPKNAALNETHIINKPHEVHSPAIQDKIKETGVQLNCTVTLETMHSTATVNLNETKILPKKQQPPSNLLTDDDDSFDVPPQPSQTPNKKQPVKTKPIFSPYGNSPVKKRVAAFEKLGTTDVPTRVTRTKTRNQEATQPQQETPLNKKAVPPPPVTLPSKIKKNFTPISNNKLPSLIPQSENKYKTKNTSVASSEAPVKSLTAVKASRAELQERREEEQKRKQEHENEVKRKKEALLQAKIEEQKRKREEKQLKAQKAREAKDREKEEKIRRIIQEKEEKLAKEEQMKREWMAQMAKKAAEEEKVQQMIKQEKLEQKRKLNKKPPPLPTDDLQDTDEEEDNPKHKYVGPLWSQRQNLYPTLYCQRYIPAAIKKEFFQMQAQTPDLLEIFETVNADILRRNSSAVWRTPPRYSTLPKF